MNDFRDSFQRMDYSIREIAEKASEMEEAVRFDIGQPDYPMPEKAREHALRAIKSERISYTSLRGMEKVREMISEFESGKTGYSSEDIMVTTGGTGALYSAFSAVCQERDNIIANDPSWSVYDMISVNANVELRRVPYFENGVFKPQNIREKLDKNTSAIIVNSPENPTGRVYRRKDIKKLVEIAREHDLWIISDEVYDRIVYKGEHVSPAELAPERTIMVNSASKNFSMTGWRIGWMACKNREFLHEAGKANRGTTACPNYPAQKALMGALEERDGFIPQMVEKYRYRKNLVTDLLEDALTKFVEPEGGMYVFINTERDSWSFTRKLLEEEHVAVVPGTSFGTESDSYVRLCFGSVGEEEIKKGLERLKKQLIQE